MGNLVLSFLFALKGAAMPVLKLTGITSFFVAGESVVADGNGIATVSDVALASPEFAALRISLEDGQKIEFASIEVQESKQAKKKDR